MSISFDGNLVYLAEKDRGIQVFDVTNPETPAKIFFYDTPGTASGLTVNDGNLYVAEGDGGLLIFYRHQISLPLVTR